MPRGDRHADNFLPSEFVCTGVRRQERRGMAIVYKQREKTEKQATRKSEKTQRKKSKQKKIERLHINLEL